MNFQGASPTFYVGSFSYLYHNDLGKALDMLKKYAASVRPDASAWKQIFDLLRDVTYYNESFVRGTQDLITMLEEWNQKTNMGEIVLDEETQKWIEMIKNI